MGDAVRLVDGDLPRATALGELVAEAALAGSCIGDHADDLRVPRDRLLERRLERGHLALAADELGEAARVGDVEAGPHPPDALELEDVQQVVQPLDAGFAQIAELEVAGHELGRVPGEERLPGIGHLLHALREPDRVAERRVVHAEIVADLPDHDLARVEAHADREPEAVREAHLVRVAPQLVLQVERGPARALRVVLVRDRGAEERHDPVAGVLVDGPLEPVHAVGEELEEAIHDAVPFLRVEPLGELHRPLHVGEEDGDLFALALERGLRGQDLLGEVLRCVRARRVLGRGRRQRVPAAEAESHLGRVRLAAPGARSLGSERAAAVAAEGGVVRKSSLARGAGHASSSRATCSARIGAPISVKSRCASRSAASASPASSRRRARSARSW